ncbi:hypothetical protein EON80_31555, partial [bacterium]
MDKWGLHNLGEGIQLSPMKALSVALCALASGLAVRSGEAKPTPKAVGSALAPPEQMRRRQDAALGVAVNRLKVDYGLDFYKSTKPTFGLIM